MTRIHQDVRVVEPMETLFLAGSLCGLSDGALLERFQADDEAGSESAFAELVKRHGPMVLGTCRRILADPHLAEDALQAAFLVLARRAGSVRNRESLGGWLHRVACRIAWRSRKRADRRRAKEEPMIEDVAAKPADRAEDAELRAIIDQEIDRLRDPQRLPVVLCCLQGFSHEEAAARLRWPLGTVKSRLARGRETLQQRLVRRGVAPALAAAVASGARSVEAAVLSPSLVKSTAAMALKTGAAGAGASAAVSALACEELQSALAVRLKLGAAMTAGGLAVATVGFFGPPFGRRDVREENAPRPAAIPAVQPGEEPPAVIARLSAAGRVVDLEGKPIAGAEVYIREWTVRRARGIPQWKITTLLRGQVLDAFLAEQRTDAEGRFEFKDVPAPEFPDSPDVGKTEFPWDVVARAPGRGLGWLQLTRTNQVKPITLTLGDEGIVRGRLVEPGGKPIANAMIRTFGIDHLSGVLRGTLDTEDRLNLIWSGFLTVMTGTDGRFTIRGLPRGKIARILATEPRHERIFANAVAEVPGAGAETQSAAPADLARSDPSSDGAILRGEFTLTACVTDHVLRGRVVLESDGKPAAKATFISGWFAEKLDTAGRFRIEGLAPGKVDLHAYDDASDAAPGEVDVTIPEEPKETEYTLVLPRGLVIRGRVVDGSTGRGVEKVEVRFNSETKRDSRFGFYQHTDSDGRYRIVAPAGKGVVEVLNVPAEFDTPSRGSIGDPPSARYSKAVEGRAGQTVELLDIPLQRAGQSTIRVVDKDGKPVFHAEVTLIDESYRPAPIKGRTDAEGRYRLVGRASDKSATVDVLSADGEQGGTVDISPDDAPGEKRAEIEVRLAPRGTLSGRVLDDRGEPLPGATPILYRTVSYPERQGLSFGKPVESGLPVASDGAFTVKRLIPGAAYYIHVDVDGHATSTSQHVKVNSGEDVKLADFRLPATDRELSGVVLDPRGKPVVGASVSYRRKDRSHAVYAPKNGDWHQQTDSEGRFRLTGLPRGDAQLMAYRNEGAGRAIRNFKYVDVAEGQKDVRIELPDVNERLRGIE